VTTQTIQHELAASWWTPEGDFTATAAIRCEPVQGWRRRGDIPGAVMAHARRLHTTLTDQHPDAHALKVDILEALLEWDDTGKARRLSTSRIGQWPSDADELAAVAHWNQLRQKDRNR
jgi:hypothetical protein